MNNLMTIILLCILILGACTSSEDCCTNIDTILTIQYQDDGGQCILDKPNFDERDIDIFYLNDTEYEKVDFARLANPRGFRVNEDSLDCSSIDIFLSYYYTENTSTTLIKGISPTPDTIVAQFDLSDGNEILESCTINGIPYTERQVILIR